MDAADFPVKATQFVPTVYRDGYPAIDPLAPALSQRGKNVIITGGGQGVGRVSSPGSVFRDAQLADIPLNIRG